MSRPMFECATCGQTYTNAINAMDCGEQDALEAYDRDHGRLFGINQDYPEVIGDDD